MRRTPHHWPSDTPEWGKHLFVWLDERFERVQKHSDERFAQLLAHLSNEAEKDRQQAEKDRQQAARDREAMHATFQAFLVLNNQVHRSQCKSLALQEKSLTLQKRTLRLQVQTLRLQVETVRLLRELVRGRGNGRSSRGNGNGRGPGSTRR